MQHLRAWMEQSAFGVCSQLADYMGISRMRVRLYFIYLSCLTLGSPVVVYLFAAFWLNIKKYIHHGRKVMQ